MTAAMLVDGAIALTLGVSPAVSNVSASKGPLPEVLLPFAGTTPDNLWHEFWHAGLGLGDAQAVQRFGIAKSDGQTDSNAFEHWLNNDCKNP